MLGLWEAHGHLGLDGTAGTAADSMCPTRRVAERSILVLHGRNRRFFERPARLVIFLLGSADSTVLASWCRRHFTRPFSGS